MRLEAPQDTFSVGEAVTVDIVLVNGGETKIRFIWTLAMFVMRVTATGPDGTLRRGTGIGGGDGRVDSHTVEAGETRRFPLLMSSRLDFSQPGQYVLACELPLADSTRPSIAAVARNELRILMTPADPEAASRQARALGREYWRDELDDYVRFLHDALPYIKSPVAAALMQRAIRHPSPYVRADAAWEAASMPEGALEMLTLLSRDPDRIVRQMVASRLDAHKGEGAMGLAEALLEDSDAWVRGAALVSLVEMDREAALARALKMSRNDDDKDRQRAAGVLVHFLPDETARARLEQMRDDPSKSIAQFAAQGIAERGNRPPARADAPAARPRTPTGEAQPIGSAQPEDGLSSRTGESPSLIWRESSGVALGAVQTPDGFAVAPAAAAEPIFERMSRPEWADAYLLADSGRYYLGNARRGQPLVRQDREWIIDGATGQLVSSPR